MIDDNLCFEKICNVLNLKCTSICNIKTHRHNKHKPINLSSKQPLACNENDQMI